VHEANFKLQQATAQNKRLLSLQASPTNCSLISIESTKLHLGQLAVLGKFSKIMSASRHIFFNLFAEFEPVHQGMCKF